MDDSSVDSSDYSDSEQGSYLSGGYNSASSSLDDEHDEQYHQAFGGLSKNCRRMLRSLKNNDQNCTCIYLPADDASSFTNDSFELVAQYIANNTHLREMSLDYTCLTDEQVVQLFTHLTKSNSLESMGLGSMSEADAGAEPINTGLNGVGINGLRSMVPFLQNTPQLDTFHCTCSPNVNAECFRLLIDTFHGNTKLIEISVGSCNIDDISALKTCSIPNLSSLSLHGNKIGSNGCKALSYMLKRKVSSLSYLDLGDNSIGDEGAEILATSLKQNSKLGYLSLDNNNITERGSRSFLKLVNDISSIESTYNSNHTLEVSIGTNNEHINSALKINDIRGRFETPRHANSRAKVIQTQLNSQNRKNLCDLQGVEFSPSSIFADIDPILLPEILALIGERHGNSELYTALVSSAPDLLSFINRKNMIKTAVMKNSESIAALTRQANALTLQANALSSQNIQLMKRLATITDVEEASQMEEDTMAQQQPTSTLR